jgi:hypothetical protein
MAYHPACKRPDLTATDLLPVAPVPGFTSESLYRCPHVRLSPNVTDMLPSSAQCAVSRIQSACYQKRGLSVAACLLQALVSLPRGPVLLPA